MFTPSTAILPADTRDIVVSVACQSSTEPAVKAFVVQYRALILEVVSSPVFVPLEVQENVPFCVESVPSQSVVL